MFRRRRRTLGVLVLSGVVLALVVSRCGGDGAAGVATTGRSSSGAAGSTTATSTGATAGATTSGTTAGSSSAASRTTGKTATPVPVTQRGAGTFTFFEVPAADTASTGRSVTYTVQVENGIGGDGRSLAAVVQHTLVDQRGWQTQLPVHFVHLTAEQVEDGRKPDIVVTFASPDTVDKLCSPAQTNGEVSCANAGRAVLNYLRWQRGVPYYPNDLAEYREYMVNHEVGHLLGFGHRTCPGAGKPAPVMQQQTLGLHGCTKDPWPHHDDL